MLRDVLGIGVIHQRNDLVQDRDDGGGKQEVVCGARAAGTNTYHDDRVIAAAK